LGREPKDSGVDKKRVSHMDLPANGMKLRRTLASGTDPVPQEGLGWVHQMKGGREEGCCMSVALVHSREQ
jgi:hypothetical protein